MENPFKKVFEKKEEKGTDVVDNTKIEKAMQRIEKDAKLKVIYDSWLGKKDKQGSDMQTKLLEFLSKNPGEDPVYRDETEEFERQSFQSFN